MKYHNTLVTYDQSIGQVIDNQFYTIARNSKNKKRLNQLLRFQSKFEFEVYQSLLRHFGCHRIICQYPIRICRNTLITPRGKDWKIDFAVSEIYNKDRIELFVEAKGYPTRDFLLSLSLLYGINRETFDKLRIVFPNGKIPKAGEIGALHRNRNLNMIFDFKRFATYLTECK